MKDPPAAESSISWFEAAAPFLGALLLLVVGALMAHLAAGQIMKFYEPAFKKAALKGNKHSVELEPRSVHSWLDWALDGSQILGVCLAAALGLALVGYRSAPLLIVDMVVVVSAAVGATVFLLKVDPVTYHAEPLIGRPGGLRISRIGLFTPVAILGIAVNVVAGIVAVYVAT